MRAYLLLTLWVACRASWAAYAELPGPCTRGRPDPDAPVCRLPAHHGNAGLVDPPAPGPRTVSEKASGDGPLAWKPARAAALAATTVLLYAFRHEIRDELVADPSEGGSALLGNARTMGKGAFAPTLALGFWTTSLATKDLRRKETAILLLESAGGAYVAAGVGQFVLATDRPREGDDVSLFRTGGHGVSTDVALAASIVPVLQRRHLRVGDEDRTRTKLWKRIVSGALWTGTILTAWQRIESDAHWAPDVFLGAVTGFAVGHAVCDRRERRAVRTGRSSWRVGPIHEGIGVTVSFPIHVE